MSKILYLSFVVLFLALSFFLEIPLSVISISFFIMLFCLLLDIVIIRKITSRTLLALLVGSIATIVIVFIIVFTYYIVSLITGINIAHESRYTMYIFVAIVLSIMYIMFSITFSFLPEISNIINKGRENSQHAKILDTSVIVDGRIADIAEKGFFDGYLIVPAFVIKEIQAISDSHDGQKRIRGRRALDMLNKMKGSKNVIISITEIDFPEIKEVDLKLIELSKKMSAKVITNDFNLMKVAEIHGVDILNINDLANMLYLKVIPGDIMQVSLVKEGKEKQALSYMEDGTMIVVDNAKHLIGREVSIKIESILPKEAGRVIFASIQSSTTNNSQTNDSSAGNRKKYTAKHRNNKTPKDNQQQ